MMRLFLIISCFICFNPNLHAATDPCDNRQCIAIVDVGSTGSRLHVYSYDTDQTNTPIHINEVWSKKIKPGFATIEANKNAIAAYMNNLLSDSPSAHVPLYFYATAGMRLLPPQKQQMYYQEVKNWFSNQSQWVLADAKTITGTDEALYDWLSVNYHLDTLNPTHHKPIGVMDMGGASVQIVFPVQDKEITGKNQIKINLYGEDIILSVHSFLGLGQTEVAHQFLNSKSCFPNGFPLPNSELGEGDAVECQQKISALMNAVHGVNRSIQPLLAANPVDSWFAIGGISNMADNKPLHFENNQLTLNGLLTQTNNTVCHQQWDTLNAQYPNDDYIYGYCLFAAYYYALIVDGYGLYPEQLINYIPPKQNLDWTTGVVLAHNSSKAKSSLLNKVEVL